MNLTQKAKEFAFTQHGNQKYGDRPYSYHLARVFELLAEYGHATDSAIAAAGWLHDTLEDTETTYSMLASLFGREVADIVQAVTNEPGDNRKERFQKTAIKILANTKALAVKLADRIANTEASLETNPKLYKMYVKEFSLFKELLYDPQDIELLPLWDRLERANSFVIGTTS